LWTFSGLNGVQWMSGGLHLDNGWTGPAKIRDLAGVKIRLESTQTPLESTQSDRSPLDSERKRGGSVKSSPDPYFTNVDPAADPDHVPYPRGSTPLLTNLPVAEPLAGYSSSELIALMQRGATRLMIEKYSLECSHECSIFACADEDLYEEFSGPQMGTRDWWKI
ncbi:hypothetical protein DXG01_014382, partial [Tephrocybe rancida]